MLGSGCGTVGQAVASDTKDPRFESRQQHNFIYQLYNRKDENKEKETREWSILKKSLTNMFFSQQCFKSLYWFVSNDYFDNFYMG